MKRYLVCLLLVLTCVISSIANVRVLTIGVSDYPASSGWNKINAHNDVERMKALFPKATVLENEKATYSGIVGAMQALGKSIAPGDTIIVHFSGHGQQIITRKSTEEQDGVDEALVPFDACKRKGTNYSGDKHLVDDTFGAQVDAIRKSLGASGLVIVLIDACHSDSMDKDASESEDVYRGTNEIFGTEEMSEDQIDELRSKYRNRDSSNLTSSKEMSNIIYLSACRSDQRNHEIVVDGNGFGSLTFYFCKAYTEVGLSNLNTLLDKVYTGMEADKTLKFHGQLPLIRNTINWVAPQQNIPTVLPEPYGEDESGKSTVTYYKVAGGVAAILIIILLIVWIAKKRKA